MPSGVENSMFQFGKLAIQSTVSLMGTAAIAAQGMASIIAKFERNYGNRNRNRSYDRCRGKLLEQEERRRPFIM